MSSWGPQPNDQPPPPIAQAPKEVTRSERLPRKGLGHRAHRSSPCRLDRKRRCAPHRTLTGMAGSDGTPASRWQRRGTGRQPGRGRATAPGPSIGDRGSPFSYDRALSSLLLRVDVPRELSGGAATRREAAAPRWCPRSRSYLLRRFVSARDVPSCARTAGGGKFSGTGGLRARARAHRAGTSRAGVRSRAPCVFRDNSARARDPRRSGLGRGCIMGHDHARRQEEWLYPPQPPYPPSPLAAFPDLLN